MNIEIREIDKKDEKKAMQFAIKGMNLNRYVQDKNALALYARYFWYMEMDRATQCIAAYVDGKFSGIMLVDMRGEEKRYRSFFRWLYVQGFKWLMHKFYSDGPGEYDKANKEMLHEFKRKNKPDGELIFLAADPDSPVKGLGSKMLEELEKREKGKQIYLYTDDGCTWQFYEHRGFRREDEKQVAMELNGQNVPIQCLLYSKRL